MNLGADILAELPFLRSQAESMMLDWCQIGFEVDSPDIDEETGEYVKVFTPVYDGPCRFKAANTAVGEIDAAGQLLVERDATLSLPIATSTQVAKDMIVKLTASQTDPGMPGVRGRVKGSFASAFATARRFAVEVTE
jgi:hypothetical protein